MIETLFGGLLGGLLRLAPEVLKWLDRASERKHELLMLGAEMEFAKVRGEIMMKQVEATMTMAELNTIGEAFKEQSATAKAAGKFVASLSAMVRPIVTYLFVGMYAAVKLASFLLAIQQGGEWKTVLLTMWTQDDMGLLMMILTFWFVGRVWERGNKHGD